MPHQHYFAFQRLDCYQLAREVARWMRTASWPPNTRHLQTEAIRAADSVVLNIAEGVSRRGRSGANHLRIARASAGEAFAALDIVDLPGGLEQQSKLQRVRAMLQKLHVRG